MKVLLISDFNLQNLAHLLNNDANQPLCTAEVAPFGQVANSLANSSQNADFAFVWTLADRAVPSFNRLLKGEAVDDNELSDEVDEFARRVMTEASRFRGLFLASWTLPPYWRRRSIKDFERGHLKHTLMRMNLQLADSFTEATGVHILDAQEWMGAAGKRSFSPKLWYLSKTPFHADVFQEVGRDIKAGIAGLLGQAKKLIVLDLDNTLWGGTVGDCGWQNVRLGGHDYLGEAFVDFQKALKSLSEAGVVLALASKNEESVAFEVIRRHPEMILRSADFAAWRINWKDKAVSVAELAEELNIGLQSVLFIDDNPAERARVREALPEVYVPEWPDDPTSFASCLLGLTCFDTPHLTAEDRLRVKSYTSEKTRAGLRETSDSHEQWLLSLDTRVVAETLNAVNLPRFVQLFNKTNQMNLTTRRMTEVEVLQWLEKHQGRFWTFRVNDRCGDSGITGIVGIEITGHTALLTDFILSCRVMGRHVEKAMLAVAVEYCRSRGLQEIIATYVPTAKNKPCLDFWQSSGFRFDASNRTFVWTLDQPYPLPPGITLISLISEQPQEAEAAWVLPGSTREFGIGTSRS